MSSTVGVAEDGAASRASVPFAATVRANFGAGSASDTRLMQRYVGNPPRSTFYATMHFLNALRPLPLGLAATAAGMAVLISLAGLYSAGKCYSAELHFHELLLAAFLGVMGASSAEFTGSAAVNGNGGNETAAAAAAAVSAAATNNKAFCGIVLSLNAFLQVAFKSVVFAVMVNKLTKITPRLYFTPKCVINFRDGVPVLMMRILNAQGTLLELSQIHAQWVLPHTTREGEHHGSLHDLRMKAFIRMRSPTSLSHIIDHSSPLHGQRLDRLRGAIFVTVHFWDPANQREVRHSAKYSLPDDLRFNHRFADLTTRTKRGFWAADVNRFGVTVRSIVGAGEGSGTSEREVGNANGGITAIKQRANAYAYSGGGKAGGGKAGGGSLVMARPRVERPWYTPDWNLARNAAKLKRGKITLMIGARFHRGRLVPRCDFSAFVEMCLCECGIAYARYLLDLDSKSTYVSHFPESIKTKNIPFLHDGKGEWFSLSVSCMKGGLATKPSDATSAFARANPEVPEYDHKTFSEAVMRHLTHARGTLEEQEAAVVVRAFLQKYEDYFVGTGHGFLSGTKVLNFQDCQLIPHISAHAALWRRVKKRSEMLDGFPRLQRWHDDMVQRESFLKTWPQGYAPEVAVQVVADMAVDKARAMYDFEFPDLLDGEDETAATGLRVLQDDENATEIGAFCL